MFLSAETEIKFIYIQDQIICEVVAINFGLICPDLQRGHVGLCDDISVEGKVYQS